MPVVTTMVTDAIRYRDRIFTAREGNRILGLTGRPFWQDESYEFERITRSKPGWRQHRKSPWSSARPIENRPQVDNLPHLPFPPF